MSLAPQLLVDLLLCPGELRRLYLLELAAVEIAGPVLEEKGEDI
ncbi:hypothetical protein [Sphingobium sp. 3R8]|nr:hypothetical protein [Sphingobium sp. 3R8]